jgi:hypothetical protein
MKDELKEKLKTDFKTSQLFLPASIFIVIYVIAQAVLSDGIDFSTSIVPGWHISIHKSEWFLLISSFILTLPITFIIQSIIKNRQ